MGIESVQARIGEIQNRIAAKTVQSQSNFQTVLSETMNGNQSAFNVNGNYANVLQGAMGTTGRYCSKCGIPEMQGNTYAQYTGSVDTSDGMLEKAAPYMDIIEEASSVYGVPVNVIMGVIKAESDFNPKCVSSAGAMGADANYARQR